MASLVASKIVDTNRDRICRRVNSHRVNFDQCEVRYGKDLGRNNSLSLLFPIDCSKTWLLLAAYLAKNLACWVNLSLTNLLSFFGMLQSGNQSNNASLYISWQPLLHIPFVLTLASLDLQLKHQHFQVVSDRLFQESSHVFFFFLLSCLLFLFFNLLLLLPRRFISFLFLMHFLKFHLNVLYTCKAFLGFQNFLKASCIYFMKAIFSYLSENIN